MPVDPFLSAPLKPRQLEIWKPFCTVHCSILFMLWLLYYILYCIGKLRTVVLVDKGGSSHCSGDMIAVKFVIFIVILKFYHRVHGKNVEINGIQYLNFSHASGNWPYRKSTAPVFTGLLWNMVLYIHSIRLRFVTENRDPCL